MNWIYLDVIKELRKQCRLFLEGRIEIKELQRHFYIAEHKVDAIEEKWLRQLLFDIENDIELSLYTIDRSMQFKTFKPKIENFLNLIC